MFRAALCPSSGAGDYTDIGYASGLRDVAQQHPSTYSPTPHLHPTITKVMYHML